MRFQLIVLLRDIGQTLQMAANAERVIFHRFNVTYRPAAKHIYPAVRGLRIFTDNTKGDILVPGRFNLGNPTLRKTNLLRQISLCQTRTNTQ